MKDSLRRVLIRDRNGGVLPLLMTICVIIFIVVMIAIAMNTLHLVDGKLRSSAEKVALELAINLNDGDRIGEMNSMTEYSRELVFTSRDAHNRISYGYAHIEPLARVLLDEAREGARQVETERNNLASVICKDSLALKKMKENNIMEPVNVLFFKVNPEGISTLEVGSCKFVPSNAVLPVGIPELRSHDRERRFTFESSDYYRADIDVFLPDPDGDLKFRFSSLAPMVKKTVSQPRLVSPGDFEPLATLSDEFIRRRSVLRYMPSAVRMVTKTNVKAPMDLGENMAETITVTTSGSQFEEKQLTDLQPTP